MKVLLVSATRHEVESCLKKLQRVPAYTTLPRYCFGNHLIDVVVTGVGMTATAFHLGSILGKKYDLAINAGVAGSFKKTIPMGMVVNVVNDCFADLGAEEGEKFLTLKEIGIHKPGIHYKPRVRSSKITNVLSNLLKANAISVNTVHGNPKSIKKIVKKFNPDVESMEGAAFFFACNQFKTPCVQIRAVSNYVERRNKKKWKMELAVRNLNLFLEGLFLKIV